MHEVNSDNHEARLCPEALKANYLGSGVVPFCPFHFKSRVHLATQEPSIVIIVLMVPIVVHNNR